MKKLAFFILLSLVTLGVSAQSNLKWNVNAGIGMSNWYGDDGLKRFDAGLGLGVAFEFGKIVVGVETGTSFTKVASGASAYNLSALATIGYKF